MSNSRNYPAIRPMPEPQALDPTFGLQQTDLFLDPALTLNNFETFTQTWDRRPSYDIPQAQYCASDSSEGSTESMWGGAMDWGDTQPIPIHPYLPPNHFQQPTAPLYARGLSSPTSPISPRESNAKRDASTAASARFRQKKKQRERSLEENLREKREKIGMMEDRIKELEGENGFLKELVMGRIKWKEANEKNGERNGGEEVEEGSEE